MKRKKRSILGLLSGTLITLLCLGVILFFFTCVNNLRQGEGEEGREQLENSLRRASVACYAAEGIYPPNVEYLEKHYGIQINRERYAVFYTVFANNLMPDITVLENK